MSNSQRRKRSEVEAAGYTHGYYLAPKDGILMYSKEYLEAYELGRSRGPRMSRVNRGD